MKKWIKVGVGVLIVLVGLVFFALNRSPAQLPVKANGTLDFGVLTSTAGVPTASITAISVGAVIDQLMNSLNQAIESARQKLDFQMEKAVVRAKDALDAWRQANTDLINLAFEKLSRQQQDFFDSINFVLASAASDVESAIQRADALLDRVDQMVSSLPLTDKRALITRVKNRLIYPGKKGDWLLNMKGRNLDKAELVVVTKNSLQIKGSGVTPSDVVFKIPLEQLEFLDNEMNLVDFTLNIATPHPFFLFAWFGVKQVVTKAIPVVILPKRMASYEFTQTYKSTVAETKVYSITPEQFKAKNENVRKVIPPEAGYIWAIQDRNAFQVIQGTGEAGRCEGILWAESSPNGIVMVARLDQIRDWSRWGPGYVNCTLAGPITRDVTTEVISDKIGGNLNWTSDVLLPIESNLVDFTLTLKLFDGKIEIVTGNNFSKFVKVKKTPRSLVITPQISDTFFQ
jgi:hypothetical protein